ncbi:hypothetical protein SAMN05216548_12118 [Faunimonas pinastri]|uniref:Uncharacterized protein n=1 Tax=Faunimonas pinastri TaxID=1855383 RepID=A0A1H9PL49_9HYPH|nr:hypothetical protein SAMN05216548_12118 [Faunimonas pinastri]
MQWIRTHGPCGELALVLASGPDEANDSAEPSIRSLIQRGGIKVVVTIGSRRAFFYA